MKEFWRKYKKIILVILYILLPLDFIPEFLFPIIGPIVALDDASLVVVVLAETIIKNFKENRKNKEDSPEQESI
jgi:uncharacterized membrane protein YkvA (DUF1232 family)